MIRSSRTGWIVLVLALGGVLWLTWSSAGKGTEAAAVELGARDDAPAPGESPAELVAIEAPAPDSQRSQGAPTRVAESAESAGAAPSANGPWVLRGRVVDASGARVEKALVGLISLHEGAPGHRGDRAVALSGERGEFTLEVPEWAAEARVLLVARQKGHQPFSEIVQLDRAFVSRVHELALGVGYEISGRVVRDGAPVAEARVSIDVAYGTGGIFDAGSEAWWANGRLEEKHGEAHTAADGSFRIPGMGPYEHRVEVHADQRDVPRVAGHLFAIEAPDSRVYDLTGARIAVTVTDASGSVSGARIHVTSGGHGVIVESADAPVVVEVPPYAKVAVEVTHPLSRPVHAELESSAAGSLRECVVPLDSVSRPSLTVLVPGADRAGLDRLRLRMQLIHGYADAELEASPSGVPDCFHVPIVPLDPGQYNLILEPDDRSEAGRYVAPRTQAVELPASGTLHAEFSLELSGRCDVRIRSPREEDWSAVVRVLDAEGHCHYERHRFHSAPRTMEMDASDGSVWELEWEHDELVEFDLGSHPFTLRGGSKFRTFEEVDEVARRCGVLRPGAYTLEVQSNGHATWRGPIAIDGGKTTRVDVQLVPAD